MEAYLQYLPTAVVTLILGLIAQRVVRAGKKDEVAVQQAANRLTETQVLIEAQEERIRQLNADLVREREWRMQSDEEVRTLRAVVVGQVEVTAALHAEQPTNRE